MTRWPHQTAAVNSVLAAIDAGDRAICLTVPTGGGKTVIMQDLAVEYLDRHRRVILYTNRRLLIEQLRDAMTLAGIDHGIRAAGHAADPDAMFQIASAQTEARRNLKDIKLWHADLVLVDEAHINSGPQMSDIISWHLGIGAAVVGLTATPIGMRWLYKRLIQPAVNADLRTCGALVRAVHYGPDEPDLRKIRQKEEGAEFGEEQARTAMGPKVQLFGRISEWFYRLNPGRKRTVLFAPGVPESAWIAQQFDARGVKAAHIDGDAVWVDGEFRSGPTARRDVQERFRAGEIVVLCNRFVLREGIDVPEVEHLIFATVFGSLQTYLQAGGRGLRACPGIGKTRCTVQDHGGNWHRHGSLNADRWWDLHFTAAMYSGMREDRLREKKIPEPVRCFKCGAIIANMRPGTKCLECGQEFRAVVRTRPVVTAAGELKEVSGDIYKPRTVRTFANTAQLWATVYFRCRNAKTRRLTFRQALGLFVQENHYYPPKDLKWMPVRETDWFLPIKEVARGDLIGCNQEDG